MKTSKDIYQEYIQEQNIDNICAEAYREEERQLIDEILRTERNIHRGKKMRIIKHNFARGIKQSNFLY